MTLVMLDMHWDIGTYFMIWESFFSLQPIATDYKIPHVCKYLLGWYITAYKFQGYPYKNVTLMLLHSHMFSWVEENW